MRVTLAFLVAVMAFAAAPIAAQQQSRWARDSMVYEHLGLSPDQRDKIRAIRDQVMQQNAPLRDQIKQVLGGKSFRDLTPEQRDAVKPQVEPLRKQMMENRKKGHDQIDAILTPDQRKQLKHDMHEHKHRHKEG